MRPPGSVVVVGASLAGATAAATLRDEGYDGRVILVGAEPLPPYERPGLSKEVLRGEASIAQQYVRPQDWYADHGVELRAGTPAVQLDVGGQEVVLAGGERLSYDRLLLATGCRNRTLAVPGSSLDGIFELRTAEDAAAIAEAAAARPRVVCVGMGFIGAEVAASLRMLSCDVTVVEVFETTLYRILGPDIGRVLEGIHRDHGVTMVFNDTVARFEGDDRVEAVITSAGRRIDCDAVVIGVGTEPAVELMAGTGLDRGDGICVDATLETEIPGVFAIGDVANHDHPVFGRIRVEHFDNAVKMGVRAATNIMKTPEGFDDPHWFWSDQYEHQIQMAGYAPTWERMVVRGSMEARSFCAFLLDGGGILRGTISLDWPRDVRRSSGLISAQSAPDPAALADPGVDLRTLVAAGEG